MKHSHFTALRRLTQWIALGVCAFGLAHPLLAQTMLTSRVDTISGVGANVLVGYCSIKVSPITGQPSAAAYDSTARKLVFTSYSGTAWSAVATVPDLDGSTNYGLHCSLAFNASGQPAIAYYDAANRSLKYTRLNGAVWTGERVAAPLATDATGTIGQYCSLGIAPDGTAHIASYSDIASGFLTTSRKDLVISRRVGATWMTSNIDCACRFLPIISRFDHDVGQYASLTFRPDGQPSVSYLDATNSKIKLASYAASTSTWTIEVVATGTGATSLAYNSEGRVAISFSNGGETRVATRGLGWTSDLVTDSGAPVPSAVAFTPSGQIVVACYSILPAFVSTVPAQSILRVATERLGFFGSSFSNADLSGEVRFTPVGQPVVVAVSMAIGLDGLPLVCNSEAFSGDLKVSRLSGWTGVVVDTAGVLGEYTSLGFTPLGQPGISYYDRTGQDLKYAERRNDGTWGITAVDTLGDVGYDTSLSYGTDGQPQISYNDKTTDLLKHAQRNALGGWTLTGVGTFAGVNYSTSLAQGPDGQPGISRFDSVNKNLMYMFKTPAGWSSNNVDSEWDTGAFSSLAYSANGQPGIAYIDLTKNVLTYAERSGRGVWNFNILSFPGQATTPSLIYGTNGQAGIACRDPINQDLKYMELSPRGRLSVRTIDSAGDVGFYLSLARGNNGEPGISYVDLTDSDLKYAERTPQGTWRIYDVDTAGLLGSSTSLAFGADGQPCISYGYQNTNDLKYAERVIFPAATGPDLPLSIQALTRDPVTKEMTLSWLPATGKRYDVEFSLDLGVGSWSRLNDAGGIIPTKGMTFYRTSPLIGQHPKAFFRVKRRGFLP